MNGYALTYPQLMKELIDHGLGEHELIMLRRAYDLAERMTDGLYRPSGASFLSHLVRTASITLRVQPAAPIVGAALVHASYSLGRLGGISARLTRRAPRAKLRRLAGETVEDLVYRYDGVPWNTEAALRMHIAKVDGYTDAERGAVTLRLANQLEDHLDAATTFLQRGITPEGRLCAQLCPELARRMKLDMIAEELEAAFVAESRFRPPAALQRDHQFAYTVRSSNLPEFIGLRRKIRELASLQRRRQRLP